MAGGGEQGTTCLEQAPKSSCLLQEPSVVVLNIYSVQMGATGDAAFAVVTLGRVTAARLPSQCCGVWQSRSPRSGTSLLLTPCSRFCPRAGWWMIGAWWSRPPATWTTRPRNFEVRLGPGWGSSIAAVGSLGDDAGSKHPCQGQGPRSWPSQLTWGWEVLLVLCSGPRRGLGQPP